MDENARLSAVSGLLKSILEDRRFFFIVMTAVSLWVLWSTAKGDMWGDLDHYYKNAGDVLSGSMPYSGMARVVDT